MKKIIFPSILALLLFFSVSLAAEATAATPYTLNGGPSIYIQNDIAFCSGEIQSGNRNDYLSLEILLTEGNRSIQSWSSAGKGSAKVRGKCSVKSGHHYTLLMRYSVNGVRQPEKITSAWS